MDDFDAEARENCKDLACARIYCSSPEGLKQLYPLAKETTLNPINRLSHTSNEMESIALSIAPGPDDLFTNKSNAVGGMMKTIVKPSASFWWDNFSKIKASHNNEILKQFESKQDCKGLFAIVFYQKNQFIRLVPLLEFNP